MKFLVEFANQMFLLFSYIILWSGAILVTALVSPENLSFVNLIASALFAMLMLIAIVLHATTKRDIMSSGWLVKRIYKE